MSGRSRQPRTSRRTCCSGRPLRTSVAPAPRASCRRGMQTDSLCRLTAFSRPRSAVVLHAVRPRRGGAEAVSQRVGRQGERRAASWRARAPRPLGRSLSSAKRMSSRCSASLWSVSATTCLCREPPHSARARMHGARRRPTLAAGMRAQSSPSASVSRMRRQRRCGTRHTHRL